MSEENTPEQRIDELKARAQCLKDAVLKKREAYTDQLDEDELDLARDGDDDDDDETAERLETELDDADELRVEIEDGELEDGDAGQDELTTKLAGIADDIDDWAASLKKRGIEADDE